jgi:hypothetical protein
MGRNSLTVVFVTVVLSLILWWIVPFVPYVFTGVYVLVGLWVALINCVSTGRVTMEKGASWFETAKGVSNSIGAGLTIVSAGVIWPLALSVAWATRPMPLRKRVARALTTSSEAFASAIAILRAEKDLPRFLVTLVTQLPRLLSEWIRITVASLRRSREEASREEPKLMIVYESLAIVLLMTIAYVASSLGSVSYGRLFDIYIGLLLLAVSLRLVAFLLMAKGLPERLRRASEGRKFVAYIWFVAVGLMSVFSLVLGFDHFLFERSQLGSTALLLINPRTFFDLLSARWNGKTVPMVYLAFGAMSYVTYIVLINNLWQFRIFTPPLEDYVDRARERLDAGQPQAAADLINEARRQKLGVSAHARHVEAVALFALETFEEAKEHCRVLADRAWIEDGLELGPNRAMANDAAAILLHCVAEIEPLSVIGDRHRVEYVKWCALHQTCSDWVVATVFAQVWQRISPPEQARLGTELLESCRERLSNGELPIVRDLLDTYGFKPGGGSKIILPSTDMSRFVRTIVANWCTTAGRVVSTADGPYIQDWLNRHNEELQLLLPEIRRHREMLIAYSTLRDMKARAEMSDVESEGLDYYAGVLLRRLSQEEFAFVKLLAEQILWRNENATV